jgi:hypothetical protein
MRFRFFAVLVAMLVALATAPAVSAATVIYYSAPGETYGWAAGYGLDRGHSYARQYCEDAGGTDCQMVLECDGGWGSVAFSQSGVVGFGAACNFTEARAARTSALAACVAFSNALCWTNSTFSQGGDELPTASNLEFDMTFYAQLMLPMRNIDPGTADGEMGAKTRDAIREFQRRIGRDATGELDDELFWRLLDANGGPQDFAATVKEEVYETRPAEFYDNIFGTADHPAPTMSFSEELMTRSEDDRLMALAGVLAAGDTPCSLPALSAEPLPDASSGVWVIECREGSYTLILDRESRTVITGSSAVEAEPPPPKRPGGQKTK